MNWRRKKLLSVLQDVSVPWILVEQRDRLVRFGFEYVQAAFRAGGREILVLNDEECKDDLVQDMLEVLTYFCARLYGRQSTRKRAKKALKAVQTGKITQM